jgi:hypothetical protein
MPDSKEGFERALEIFVQRFWGVGVVSWACRRGNRGSDQKRRVVSILAELLGWSEGVCRYWWVRGGITGGMLVNSDWYLNPLSKTVPFRGYCLGLVVSISYSACQYHSAIQNSCCDRFCTTAVRKTYGEAMKQTKTGHVHISLCLLSPALTQHTVHTPSCGLVHISHS